METITIQELSGRITVLFLAQLVRVSFLSDEQAAIANRRVKNKTVEFVTVGGEKLLSEVDEREKNSIMVLIARGEVALRDEINKAALKAKMAESAEGKK